MRTQLRLGPIGGTLKVDGNAGLALHNTAEENRVAVIRAATMLEDSLGEAALVHFCFGNPDRKIALDFRAFVVGTSWCTFEGKRQLVGLILDRLHYKTSGWRKDFEKVLRTAINFRNAFTHGSFITDGVEVRLQWFSGHPQSQVLTDKWLTTVEARLDEAIEKAEEVVEFLQRKYPRPAQEFDGSGI